METEKLYADFAARVELAVANAGGPSEVARRMNVALPTLTRWRTGNADPSRTNLAKLADATGVDLSWLATGEGDLNEIFVLKQQDDLCNEDDKTKDESVKILEDQMRTRIAAIVDLYPTKAAAKDAAGVSALSLRRYISGEQAPSIYTMARLASGVGASLDWLAFGSGQMLQSGRQYGAALSTAEPLAPHDAPRSQTGLQAVSDVKDTLGNPVDLAEFTFIPRYAAKASAGHGADTQDCGKPLFSMAFRRYWIKHYLRADPANLAVISVKGDSMDGVLNDRDAILIDLSDVTPTGGLYVVRLAGDLMVKRVQKMPGGRFLLLSANPAYKEAEVDPGQEADFAVVGRVVWFGRQI